MVPAVWALCHEGDAGGAAAAEVHLQGLRSVHHLQRIAQLSIMRINTLQMAS